MQFIHQSSPLELLESRFFPGINLWVKRDDLLHPTVSGNKYRKLKYPLQALHAEQPVLVTMGGVWSNHLHATAYAAHSFGYPSIALVRGDGLMTACLKDCQNWGMQICFVTREQYRQIRQQQGAWRAYLPKLAQFPQLPQDSEQYVWLPEGGSSPAALHGVAEVCSEVQQQLSLHQLKADSMIVACGTGATMAGLLAGSQGAGRILGVAAIKNADYLHAEIAQLLTSAAYPESTNYELLTQFHHGGYAKTNPELLRFCNSLHQESGLLVEPVYTGKMFYALHQLVLAGKFKHNETVVAVHTGGLQGLRGFSNSVK